MRKTNDIFKGMDSWSDPTTLDAGVAQLVENFQPKRLSLDTRLGLEKWGAFPSASPSVSPSPSAIPPEIGSWQQAVDPTSDGDDCFGFLLSDDSIYLVNVDASTGTMTEIYTTLVFPQTLDAITITNLGTAVTPNVRQEGTLRAIMLLVWGSTWDSLIAGVDRDGTTYWHIIGTNQTEQGAYGYQYGESFEITPTGNMLAVFSNYDSGNTIQSVCYHKSTDYGVTWGPQTAIETVSTSDYYYDPPVLCKDASNNLYCVARRSFAGGFELVLFYSEDFGDTWDTKQVAVTAGFSGRYAVAVKSTTIYVLLGDTNYGSHCYVSSDEGANWTANDVSGFKGVALAASPTAIVAYGYYANGKIALYRSTDGAAFTQVYDLYANGFTLGYPDYVSLRYNDGVFAMTYCNMGTPGYLKYLRSTDDGLTWSLITTNILAS